MGQDIHALRKEKWRNDGEMRNAKPKDKPTCYHCGKIGHTTNICQSKHGMQNFQPKFIGYFFYCKKQLYQIHECMSRLRNTPSTSRFEGYYYNYQKYGNREFEKK